MVTNGIGRRAFLKASGATIGALALGADGQRHAVTPSQDEFDRTCAWIKKNFSKSWPAAKLPPFSFVYGGKPSRELLKGWRLSVESETRRGTVKQQSYLYTDPATGLVVICEMTRYEDFPAVEWTLHFKNTGRGPAPILQQVHALDTKFLPTGSRFVLHWTLGSDAKSTDFEPREQDLEPSAPFSLSPVGGRSSNTNALPFFNLEMPQVEGSAGQLRTDSLDHDGVVIGLGWSGQWSASFARESEGVRIQAGMERTHLSLQPGESIRSPRILLLFWRGSDRPRSQNLLRQFLLAHHTPMPGDHLPDLPVAACSWVAFDYGNKATEKNQIEFASLYVKKQIPIDTFWLDAGWYEGGWPSAGSWFASKDRFPHGLKPLTDAVHKMGMRFVVWFEPERVTQGTWLDRHHPEWLLGKGKRKLLNLGNEAARRWLTDHISGMIEGDGIDIYRQDFNMDPLPYWRDADAPDRQGITEIRHIEGLYKFWDELLGRFPNLMIDNCASGGRRIDLETMSRSIALWRTDLVGLYGDEGIAGLQSEGVGLALYVPLSATGDPDQPLPDLYRARSAMGAGIVFLWDVRRPDFDDALARRIVKEEKTIRKFYSGDLYPLTAISASVNAWCAYQYDRPDLGAGMIMAFRRPKATEESLIVKLRGLKGNLTYKFKDFDSGREQISTGKQLAGGLHLNIPTMPGSSLLVYQAIKSHF